MAKNTKETVTNDLASILKNALNEKLDTKSIKSVYSLEDADNPTNVKEFISTGCDALDLAISNRPNGGIPVGRITEITGLEQTGKSVFCASVIAQTQKKGGMGIYIDTESAVSADFFRMIGVDTSPTKFVYATIDLIEQVFEAIEVVLTKSIENKNKQLITICVDSIAGATTLVEAESDFSKSGYNTTKALVISQAMRKLTQLVARANATLIFTNQLRQNLNAMAFSDPYTTPGGKAIPFHSTVRIRLTKKGKLTGKINGIDVEVGQHISAKIVKNRVGPPNTTAEYDFRYSSGIDNYGSWFTILKKYKIFNQAGAWYTYTDKSTGEIIKFQSSDFNELIESNSGLKKQLYDKICEKVIVNYEGENLGVDDIQMVVDLDDDEIEHNLQGTKKEKRKLLQEQIEDDLTKSFTDEVETNDLVNSLPDDVQRTLNGV